VPDAPFDETTAPPGFLGRGTMRLLEPDRALYVDAGHALIFFKPRPTGWEPPTCF